MSSRFWGVASEISLREVIAFIDYTTQQKTNPPYTIAVDPARLADTLCCPLMIL